VLVGFIVRFIKEEVDMWVRKLAWVILGVFVLFSFQSRNLAQDKKSEVQGKKYKYAIVVKAKTMENDKWKAVVEALKEKHSNNKVFEYKAKPKDVKKELSEYMPHYICFVAPPEEIIKADCTKFVEGIHQMTRQLDKDPYTDAIWGILTGYNAEDALKIAKHKEPLKVKYALGGFLGWIGNVQEGIAYYEGNEKPGWRQIKHKDKLEVQDDKKGVKDPTKLFVDELNSGKVDIMWTSGHASQRDWQIKYPGGGGHFEAGSKGELYGVDAKGKKHKVKSENPKIYYAAGNCLIGNINSKECMALSWIHSGGAYQYLGYTVPTGYGFMGWEPANNFMVLGDKFTFAEAFYITNQQLLYGLQNKKIMQPQDLGGFQGDRDVVVLYGDPAWEARVETSEFTPKPRYEQKVRIVKKEGNSAEFEFTVKFNQDVDFGPYKRGATAIFDFLPVRVKDPKVSDKGDAKDVVVTDNFILVRYKGKVEKDSEKKVTFTATVIEE
jgi:zinc protease